MKWGRRVWGVGRGLGGGGERKGGWGGREGWTGVYVYRKPHPCSLTLVDIL